MLRIDTCSSQPNVSLSFVQMAGRTRLCVGMCDTREYKKMAASNDWKNIRAPAKKKFPILQIFYDSLSVHEQQAMENHASSET